MEITYPLAKVFTDSTIKLNVFFFSQVREKYRHWKPWRFPMPVWNERYVMFCNLHPNFTQHMLRSMYGVAPIANGRFRYYRMYAWYSDRQTNKMTEEQFKAWTDVASKARLEYKQDKISGEDLIKKIEKTNEYD